MKESDQLKALLMLQAMVVSADKFHLSVAKALLSDEPISAQQKAALRDAIAKRESVQEKQEKAFAEAAKIFERLTPLPFKDVEEKFLAIIPKF